MDDLDRMYARLVHNIRAGFPELLTQPFEAGSVYQLLVPYRLNRAELGLDTAEDYELAMTRLLCGTRGLLDGDPGMQEALRAELESPNPDLSAFRAFGTSRVSLAPDALRALDAVAASSHESRPASHTAASAQDLSRRQTEELVAPSGGRAPQPERGIAVSPVPFAAARPAHGGCRYCGGELPDGREVKFCPHCGQNLSLKHCPACSTELDVDWRFCIACGRQADLE